MQQAEENVISGYLYKRTRDGRWQKRWFETNGVYLTYYKSRKMEKLLAALSLPQVGEIKSVPPEQDADKQDGRLSIELNTRVYILRAKSTAAAVQWVHSLTPYRLDGLQAGAVQTPLTPPTPSSEDSSKGVGSTAATEWIKSGNNCCGCC